MSKHSDLARDLARRPSGAVTIEHLERKLDLTYNWGYEKTRQDLRDLYKKAQRSQWNPDDHAAVEHQRRPGASQHYPERDVPALRHATSTPS